MVDGTTTTVYIVHSSLVKSDCFLLLKNIISENKYRKKIKIELLLIAINDLFFIILQYFRVEVSVCTESHHVRASK